MKIFNHIVQSLDIYREKKFIKQQFKAVFGYKWPDTNPISFNEKLHWLKINDRNPLYTKLADKLEVRHYVRQLIGDAYLNLIYNVWDDEELINFNVLPESYVLKTTHGSGWNIICDGQNKLDITKTKRALKRWLSMNYYSDCNWEWVYKDIVPRIICEKYLGSDIYDYKIYCFHGIPQLIHVDIDRFSNHCRNFYDTEWCLQPFSLMYPQSQKDIPRPEKLDEMLQIASSLSHTIKFVRIDLYAIQENVFFGEMTFFPGNGFEVFTPSKYDRVIGDMLNIN